jgi:MFS family permease
MHSTSQLADGNRRRFIAFRVLFNARFYYPVLAILFLDLGLSATEYTLLNFVWALVIVFAEVPSGALADRIGRRPLIVAAGCCMVLEMAVLLFAPLNGGMTLLLFCLVNRVLSGTAEALASGADESLAYDSLAAEGRAGEWPNVLADVMHWQAAGMLLAMLVGATVYDPDLLNQMLAYCGSELRVTQGFTLRLPILLNLFSAAGVLWLALGMREPSVATPHVRVTMDTAWRDTLAAGAWILRTPVVLFAMLAGVVLDSVIRLLLTFGSAFYRLIALPEASFGVIGAVMAGMGMVMSPVVRQVFTHGSLLRHYLILVALTLFGLLGVAVQIPWWGVLFMIPLVAAMNALNFILSNTLHDQVNSAQRATVLSFKGLIFNLGYGLVSLLFALLLRSMRDTGNAESALSGALAILPLWLVFTLALLTWGFWRKRVILQLPADQ